MVNNENRLQIDQISKVLLECLGQYKGFGNKQKYMHNNMHELNGFIWARQIIFSSI